jgi:hypothetical protein
MIIAPRYHGDEAIPAMQQQHDAYGAALQIIVGGIQDHERSAAHILGQPPLPDLPSQFDHRTLQDAHDLLAAAWRWRSDVVQIGLPFAGDNSALTRIWLDWLREEVRGWWRQPALVTTCADILRHSNEPRGHAAEQSLAELLRQRFADIPWITRGD